MEGTWFPGWSSRFLNVPTIWQLLFPIQSKTKHYIAYLIFLLRIVSYGTDYLRYQKLVLRMCLLLRTDFVKGFYTQIVYKRIILMSLSTVNCHFNRFLVFKFPVLNLSLAVTLYSANGLPCLHIPPTRSIPSICLPAGP